MSYISNNLCHFVGRTKSSDDERFALLMQIIKEGQLKANLANPQAPGMSTHSNYQGDHLGEIFEKCDCVCFCDIPDEMLGIHTAKYSQFGMGFSKTFLARNGTRPVMYVPKDATIQEPMKTQTPTTSANAYYLYLNRLFTYLSSLLLILNDMTPLSTEFSNKIIFHTEYLNSIREFDYEIVKKFQSGNFNLMMLSEINAWATQCAYTKVFDETLAEDDPDNYYMEREWRSIKSVDFALEDIQKVYLPSQHYKEKFLSEFPEYTGDFWLFDAC